MITYRDLIKALRFLELDPSRPVIAHASLSAFGRVLGGADSVVGALLSTCETVVMPVFTYKTMLVPEVGPEHNGIVYGSGGERNRMAEFFHLEMPADRLMGIVPETLRRHPRGQRSSHPILSFAGVNAGRYLEAQTLDEPLAAIRLLAESGGWVLLLGVGHTVNTSIHLAERMSGRRTFTRWALTPEGVVECPGFPCCSDGFEALAPSLDSITRKVQAGEAVVQALPLAGLLEAACAAVSADPQALLCVRDFCDRCNAVRGIS
jgi:aminoglycoside 3-N-acetyltransferase